MNYRIAYLILGLCFLLFTNSMQKPVFHETRQKGGYLPPELYKELLKFITKDFSHPAFQQLMIKHMQEKNFLKEEFKEKHNEWVLCFAINNLANHLYSADYKCQLKIWDL